MRDDELQQLFNNLIAENTPITIDGANVPRQLHSLISLAQKWGVSEDGLRFKILRRSTDSDLEELSKVSRVYNDAFNDWLAGPEAYQDHFSDEYIAFTALRMASDEATILLEKRRSS